MNENYPATELRGFYTETIILVIPWLDQGIQTPSLRKQGTRFKDLDSCLHRKPWIPHLEASLREESLRQVRNDNLSTKSSVFDLSFAEG